MHRNTPLALALGAAFGLTFAQTPPPFAPAAGDPPALPEITVTATRTERAVDDVPVTVTVVPAAAIDRSGARDIKDLFRNEIDLTVRAAPSRFTAAGSSVGRAGNEGINIRGLEGNQVLLLVDGIRVPNSFSFGAFATGRADFLALDNVQAIEVLRGPASTQFGSDGLAGAVSLRTLDPADLLRSGDGTGGFVRLGHAGVDRSNGATLGTAVRSGAWEGLLVVGARRGEETKNRGSNDAQDSSRTAPNPLDYRSANLLAKLGWALSPAHRFGITVESQRRTQDTEVYSARARPPLGATSTLDLDTDDTLTRHRLSLEHRYTDAQGTWAQKAETRLYTQDGEVRQVSMEDRNTAADRTRDNRYRQKLLGLATQLETRLGGPGAVAHRLSYGLDISRGEFTGVRDGTVPPFGEVFPTKPFPDTTYTLLGAFVQDELEAGTFSIIPALRFDHYKLAPSADGYTGGAVVPLSDRAVTPRLGVVWRLARWFVPYGQVSRGFRAPTPDQVNNGFTNQASFYRSIGNPDLKAETAESLELGTRGQWQGLRWQFAGYDNRYEDFIAQQVVGGAGTAADPTVFQYINLSSARIRGVEARAQWQVDARWSIHAGSALSRGYSDLNGTRVALDTIEPLRAVLGLRFDAGTWELRATVLHAQSKAANRIAPATPAPFAPPAYTVLDLGASWRPLPHLTLVANVNNVFDRSYYRWSDVRGLADNSAVKDAYTAPGRNLQVSARYDF